MQTVANSVGEKRLGPMLTTCQRSRFVVQSWRFYTWTKPKGKRGFVSKPDPK